MPIARVDTGSSILGQIAQAGVRAADQIVSGTSNTPINPQSLNWLKNAGSSIAKVLYQATKESLSVSNVTAAEGTKIANTIIDLIKRNAAKKIESTLANGIAYLTHGFSIDGIEGKVHRALLQFSPNGANSHDLVSMQLQDPHGFPLESISRARNANPHPAMPIPVHVTSDNQFGQEGSAYQTAQRSNVPSAPPQSLRNASLHQAAHSPWANVPAPPALPSNAPGQHMAYSPSKISPPPPVPEKPRELADELKKSVNPLPVPQKPAGLSTTAHSTVKPEQQQGSRVQSHMQTRPNGAAPKPQIPIAGIDAWLDSLELLKPPRAEASRVLSGSSRSQSGVPQQPPMLSSPSTPLDIDPAVAIAQTNESLGLRGSGPARAINALNTQLNRRHAIPSHLRDQQDELGPTMSRASETTQRDKNRPQVEYSPPPLALNTVQMSQNTRVKNSVYMTPAQRDQCKVSVRDGYIVDAEGKRYNKNILTETSKGQSPLFVMDLNGQVYIQHRFSPRDTDHSSFLSGQPVAAAGRITIKNGKVTALELPKKTETSYLTTKLHLQFVKINLATALSISR